MGGIILSTEVVTDQVQAELALVRRGHATAPDIETLARAWVQDWAVRLGEAEPAFAACSHCGMAAHSLADGPSFGHAMTKTMLWQEWSAGLGECIEAEAQAQAICMQTHDFERAYHAFAAKQKPVFEGN